MHTGQNLRKVGRKAIRRVKCLFGHDPRSTYTLPLHDLRGVESDSKDAREASYVDGIALFNAEARKCWCVFYPLVESPFVQACRILASPKENSYELAQSTLIDYYEDWRLASLADVMKIPSHLLELNQNLRTWELNWPYEASVSPWNHAPLVARNLVPDERQIALLPENRIGDLRRFERLVESITSEGYQPHDGHDGDIVVEALVNGLDQRFIVLSGTHRASALAALGNEEMRVRIHRVVRREEAHLWPKVKNGVFREEAALAFFDQFFA